MVWALMVAAAGCLQAEPGDEVASTYVLQPSVAVSSQIGNPQPSANGNSVSTSTSSGPKAATGFLLQANAYPNLCLSAPSDTLVGGESLSLAPCTYAPRQLFAMISGTYALLGKWCIAAPSTVGAPMQLQACGGQSSTVFAISSDTQVMYWVSGTSLLGLVADANHLTATPICSGPLNNQSLSIGVATAPGYDGFPIYDLTTSTNCLADSSIGLASATCDPTAPAQIWNLNHYFLQAKTGYCVTYQPGNPNIPGRQLCSAGANNIDPNFGLMYLEGATIRVGLPGKFFPGLSSSTTTPGLVQWSGNFGGSSWSIGLPHYN